MNYIYTVLFSLSIILINPWGVMRGEIWTQPKVFAILLICILNGLNLWEERKNLKLPQSWKVSKLLWEIFLGIGLISTSLRTSLGGHLVFLVCLVPVKKLGEFLPLIYLRYCNYQLPLLFIGKLVLSFELRTSALKYH